MVIPLPTPLCPQPQSPPPRILLLTTLLRIHGPATWALEPICLHCGSGGSCGGRSRTDQLSEPRSEARWAPELQYDGLPMGRYIS